MNFDIDYIVPGDCFADQTVLCMSCGIPISRLGYKEMPKMGDASQTVKVAAKMPLGNYTQTPVVLFRRGKEVVYHILTCKECRNFDVNAETGPRIIKQIVAALQMESRWAGYPEAAAEAIARSYEDAKLIRRITAEELVDMYAKEGAF